MDIFFDHSTDVTNAETDLDAITTMAIHARASYLDPAAESPAVGPPAQEEKGQIMFVLIFVFFVKYR